MIDIVNLVEPVKDYREYLDIILITNIILLILYLMLQLAYEIDEGSIREKKGLPVEGFTTKTKVTFIILGVTILALVINVKEVNKIEYENSEIVKKAIYENISYVLKDSEEKLANGEMTPIELKTHIIVNENYYRTLDGWDIDWLEHNIKKYVYNNYDRENVLYKELVLGDKKLLQLE